MTKTFGKDHPRACGEKVPEETRIVRMVSGDPTGDRCDPVFDVIPFQAVIQVPFSGFKQSDQIVSGHVLPRSFS